MMEEPEILGSSSANSKKDHQTQNQLLNVHCEFDQVKIFNPQKDQEVFGRKCKACQKTFYGKNSTNLKAHLEKFHPHISKVITSKSEFVLFTVSNISKSGLDQRREFWEFCAFSMADVWKELSLNLDVFDCVGTSDGAIFLLLIAFLHKVFLW